MANVSIPDWLTTSTTGNGMAAVIAAATAFADGKLDPHSALIAGLAGVFLILFPQSTNSKEVATAAVGAAVDIEKVVEAYKLGMSHATPKITSVTATFPSEGQKA